MCRKLASVLLENPTADIDVAIVGDQHLDNAFMEYTHMLGGSPNALTRNYQTGQSVLRSLNGLQGQDETKIFSGVVTRKGYDLYLKILQTMSHGNKHKVSAKSLATEWNHQVDVMLSECASESQRKDVKTQYGYLGEKDAQRHADRLQLRVEQTRHAGSLGSEIQDFCSRIKELSIAIPEVELQTELRTSMARGVGGPAANTHHPSALQLPTKRASDEVEDLSNHCFQCSTIGRPLSECCIKDKSTRRPTFINGHSGHRRTVVCSFFDDKFPEGHVERATRVHRAAKDRAAAMQRFRRRKSKQAKRTPQTSPRIEEFV